MVPDHQVRRKWSGDASKKVQLFKVGGSRIIGTAVSHHDLKEHQSLRSDLAQFKVFRANIPLTSFLPKYWPPAAIDIV